MALSLQEVQSHTPTWLEAPYHSHAFETDAARLF